MRKRPLFTIFLFFLVLSSFSSLNAQWARAYGGYDGDNANSIQQTSDGGYIVAGYSSSFGAGGYDVWVLKLSSTGAIDWQHTYGGSGNDYANSIQQTSDGGYIVAGYSSSFGAGDYDVWVLKLSPTGTIDWQRTYGGSDWDYTNSIQQTSDGGYIIAGSTNSFGAGDYDVWVLKLSPTGTIDWQRTYGGSDGENANAYSIQQTNDGGYIVTGYKEFGAGTEDIWVLKLSSTGTIDWQRAYGGSDVDYAHFIQQTSDGGYIVAGNTFSISTGCSDIWVLKLSLTGTIEWQRTYGESCGENAYSIQQTSDGGYIVAGKTWPFGVGSSDAWILKLSSTGTIEWQRTYGGSDWNSANSIQQTSDGGYIATGHTFLFGAGSGDIWVLKLFSDGNIDPHCGFIGSSSASVLNASFSPGDTNITPEDTLIIPSDTSISPQPSDATVTFLCQEYILTISANTGGTTNPAPGTYIYDPGAQASVQAIPSSGYQFSRWSGDTSGTTNPVTINMDSDKSVTANFTAKPISDGDGGGGGDGLCFIATAAYSSPSHPYVKILRDFRDIYLLSNKAGRELVDLYYKYSPSVANLVARSEPLKVIVRIHLVPIIVLSYSMVHLGPITTAVILLPFLVLPLLLVRLIKRKNSRL